MPGIRTVNTALLLACSNLAAALRMEQSGANDCEATKERILQAFENVGVQRAGIQVGSWL